MNGSDRPQGDEVRTTGGHHLTGDELNRYLDQDLAPREVATAEAHLASCDQCRATLADLRAVSHLLSNLPHVEPPRSFHLGPEYARERKSWLDQLGGWLMPALPAMRAATVAVALTLGGLTAYRAFDDPPRTGPVVEQSAREAKPAATEAESSRVATTTASVAAQSGPAGAVPDGTESAAGSTEMQAPAAKTGAEAAAPADEESAAEDSVAAGEAAEASSASDVNSVMVAMEAVGSPAPTESPTPTPTATPTPAPTPTVAPVQSREDEKSWITNAQWMLGALLAGLAAVTVGLSIARSKSAP